MNCQRSSRMILTRLVPRTNTHIFGIQQSTAALEPAAAASPLSNATVRSKHSSTQIKRLFKKNPARRRVELKNKGGATEEVVIPQAQFSPILEPKMLPNGWSPPPSEEIPEYPFRVSRTKNKPNNAVGFLPVYAEFRKDGARITTRIKKVSGDQEAFLNELRAALQIPMPLKKDEDIRIRTGGTIEVKGNRVREVKEWLAGLGF